VPPHFLRAYNGSTYLGGLPLAELKATPTQRRPGDSQWQHSATANPSQSQGARLTRRGNRIGSRDSGGCSAKMGFAYRAPESVRGPKVKLSPSEGGGYASRGGLP